MKIVKDRYANEWADTNQHTKQTTALPPIQLLPDTAPPTPYPLDALTYEMRGAVEAIMEHEQVPAAIAGQCVLGAATNLMQTRVNAWHPRGKPGGAPCSLFMLSLFGSGEGKSSARNLAFKVIDDLEKDALTHHHQACAEIITCAEQLKGKERNEFLAENPLPPDPKTQYSDATFEPIAGDFIRGKPAANWDTDEGGQMLGGSSLKADTVAATLGGLTKAFDDGYFERTRSKSNAEGSGVAYNRRLSIHLLAQPIAVVEALANPLLTGQGFLARFMLAAPDSLAGSCFITLESLDISAYADPRLQEYWARCKEIAASPEYIDTETGEVKPPVLMLNTDAKKIWVSFRNKIESDLGPLGHFVELKPFARRGAEQALRIATVLGGFEGLDQIDGDCMTRACKLAYYSLREWLRYTSAETIDRNLKLAAELMAWFVSPKRTTCWKEFHIDRLGKSGPAALRTAKVRNAVLNVLLKHRYLLSNDGKTFLINPLAETADSAEAQQSCSSAIADDLLKSAEVAYTQPAISQASAKLPHTSAPHPQTKRQETLGPPQNPQNPQLQSTVDSSAKKAWSLSL